jgi:putative transposase
MSTVEHRQSKYLNNWAENSHQTRTNPPDSERAMKFFRPPGAAQRFLAVFSAISPHFRPADTSAPRSINAFEMTG